MRARVFLVAFLALAIAACSGLGTHQAASPLAVVEHPVRMIPLAGAAAGTQAELSGLEWYKDQLILVPQYPSRNVGPKDGRLFAIEKKSILSFVDNKSNQPLSVRPIDLVAPGIAERIEGFQGFEALTFIGSQAFMTIESLSKGRMHGYVVRGSIDDAVTVLTLDPDSITELEQPCSVSNMSFEALTSHKGQIYAFFEVNGEVVNPAPVARRLTSDLEALSPIPFPPLEYRVTDATETDAEGRFWVINFFFPGDARIKPKNDAISGQYGRGPTHTRSEVVERLLELRVTPGGIVRTVRPPVQLELQKDGRARNWEGIARLDGRGFLLVTDRNPQTMLAFVPGP